MFSLFHYRLLWALAPCLLLLSCHQPEKMIVAAASNTHYAMEEIEQQFESAYQQDIDIVYGSSGKLAAQIRAGAPFSIFLSADWRFPQQLHYEKLTTTPPKVYARGKLVLWTNNPNVHLDSNVLNALMQPIQHFSIPNPKIAPYGRMAMQYLVLMQLWDSLAPKMVYGENVSLTNQHIVSGVVDMGITSKSTVLSPAYKGIGQWVDLQEEVYDPFPQDVVILTYGATHHPQTSQQFFSFLFSDTAQTIFEKHGYLTNWTKP